MPRGVPTKGFRVTRNRLENNLVPQAHVINPFAGMPAQHFSVPEAATEETDDEIDARIKERFEILQILAEDAICGETRALIVSGKAGLGKSYTVEEALQRFQPKHQIIKGFVRATGLFKLLYDHREEGDVLVFDDADSIFKDETSLNLLKAVCDTTEKRYVSWHSEAIFTSDEDGDVLPKTFEFQGTIVFITNYDFDLMIARGNNMAPHFEALMSRAHYIDLSLKTKRDCLIRMRQVIAEGLLENLDVDEAMEVVEYIEDNYERLRELSLRAAIKLGNLRRASPDWRKIANITCCK